VAFYLLVLPLVSYGYVAIVAAEEAFLGEKFGAEYAQYCRRVNRWLPHLHGWRAAVAGMRFNWRRVLVKEYNTVFVVLLTLAAVKLWADYQVLGSPALPPPAGMVSAFIAWLGGYLAVRTAKKTGYVKP
jgi:protein-S-isoprenylcysteine O-methyltransferase Ste14